jgi:hypothetical protein
MRIHPESRNIRARSTPGIESFSTMMSVPGASNEKPPSLPDVPPALRNRDGVHHCSLTFSGFSVNVTNSRG